jgi:hypothetical protein
MKNKIWDCRDVKMPLVVKDSSWHFIHDFSIFNSCTGVFVFADSAHYIKFVGHTDENCILEAIAEAIEKKRDSGTTLVKVLYTQVDKDAKLIADVLMEKYQPQNNTKKESEEKIITGTNNPF